MTDDDILRLWRSRYDTMDIAYWGGVPEYEVANRLMHIYTRERAARILPPEQVAILFDEPN